MGQMAYVLIIGRLTTAHPRVYGADTKFLKNLRLKNYQFRLKF